MPRKPNIDPPTRLELKLPESLRTKLDLLLFSELEGRVPQGKYQEFFIERLNEFFTSKRLDLTPFEFAPGQYVLGAKPAIDALEQFLQSRKSDAT